MAEFVNRILASRTVPYNEFDKPAIREHLLNLSKAFPSLTLGASAYIFNDGHESFLLKAEGTVPINYQGAAYNIPIEVWVPEVYPRAPPMAFVRPTASMEVSPRHSIVDPSGAVTPPCIRAWKYPRSTLEMLVRELISIFSQEPPLYTRRSPQAKPAPQPQPQPPQRAPSTRQDPAPVYPPPIFNNPLQPGAAALYPAAPRPNASVLGPPVPAATAAAAPGHAFYFGSPPPAPAPPAGLPTFVTSNPTPPSKSGSPVPAPPPAYLGSPNGPPPPPPPSASEQQAAAAAQALRQTARRKLKDELQARLRSYDDTVMEEVSTLAAAQKELEERYAKVARVVGQLDAERAEVEAAVRELGLRTTQLRAWLAKYEGLEGSPAATLDVENYLREKSEVSRGILELSAEDLALEDVFYALERTLAKGLIPGDAYLRQVRQLSRQQFYARAKLAKLMLSPAAAAAQVNGPGRTRTPHIEPPPGWPAGGGGRPTAGAVGTSSPAAAAAASGSSAGVHVSNGGPPTPRQPSVSAALAGLSMNPGSGGGGGPIHYPELPYALPQGPSIWTQVAVEVRRCPSHDHFQVGPSDFRQILLVLILNFRLYFLSNLAILRFLPRNLQGVRKKVVGELDEKNEYDDISYANLAEVREALLAHADRDLEEPSKEPSTRPTPETTTHPTPFHRHRRRRHRNHSIFCLPILSLAAHCRSIALWCATVLAVDAVYSAFIVPFEIAFVNDPDIIWARVVDLLAGFILLIDVGLNFHVPLVLASKAPRYFLLEDGPSIARHYILSGRLLIDLLSLAPAIWAATGYIGPDIKTSPIQALRLLRLIRFAFLFRRMFGSPELSGWSGSVMGIRPLVSYVIQIVYLAMFLVNFCACLFIWVANVERSSETWMTGVIWTGGPTKSDESDLRDAPWTDQYVAAVYFTVTTFATVGYGDITANTTAERIFVTLLMLVGLLFFSLFISSLVNVLASTGDQSGECRRQRHELSKFCSRWGWSTETSSEILGFYEQQWISESATRQLLQLHKDLPERLWGRLVLAEIFGPFVRSQPSLSPEAWAGRGGSPEQLEEALLDVSGRMEPLVRPVGGVLGEDSEREALIYLHFGTVEALDAQGHSPLDDPMALGPEHSSPSPRSGRPRHRRRAVGRLIRGPHILAVPSLPSLLARTAEEEDHSTHSSSSSSSSSGDGSTPVESNQPQPDGAEEKDESEKEAAAPAGGDMAPPENGRVVPAIVPAEAVRVSAAAAPVSIGIFRARTACQLFVVSAAHLHGLMLHERRRARRNALQLQGDSGAGEGNAKAMEPGRASEPPAGVRPGVTADGTRTLNSRGKASDAKRASRRSLRALPILQLLEQLAAASKPPPRESEIDPVMRPSPGARSEDREGPTGPGGIGVTGPGGGHDGDIK